MFKFMLLKLPTRFCPLAERLDTSQGRNITKTKQVTPFPDYFFSCDYDGNKKGNFTSTILSTSKCRKSTRKHQSNVKRAIFLALLN